ncbi:MAG TPA: hypothetical protein DCY59_08710 [Micrococcaceae bacterium]|nr:hypothetical protein [Micrococcaceae bacterium]
MPSTRRTHNFLLMIGAILKPSNVDLGRVEGRFIVGIQDGADVDDEPDFIAAQGTIEFTASVPYLPDPTASPVPVTLLKTTIRGMLDSQGYLCSIRREVVDGKQVDVPGPRGLSLVATDDPDLLVQNWTWNVTYRFTAVNGSTPTIPAHGIVVPMGATVDLTTTLKVPSSPGYGLPQAEAAVLRAEAAAQVALDVKAMADAGEFDGEQGLPGNATMRVDTTAGTRIFITNGVTEHMLSADTKWRSIQWWGADGVVQGLPLEVTHGYLPLAGEAGGVYVRRINDMVYMRILAITTTSGAQQFPIPNGFSAGGTPYPAGLLRANSSTPYEYRAGGAWVFAGIANGITTETQYAIEVSWVSKSAWPTTLPGIPA